MVKRASKDQLSNSFDAGMEFGSMSDSLRSARVQDDRHGKLFLER